LTGSESLLDPKERLKLSRGVRERQEDHTMPIPEVDKIWMNGKLVDWDDAKIHVLTHALHYGSGVFEGIRAYKTDSGPAVFRLTDHLERMRRSATVYGRSM
jgi:hypothetical protein